MPDSNKPTVQQELHVNPYKKAVKDHEPAAGDYYAHMSPHFNTREIIRLKEKTLVDGKYPRWTFETILGQDDDETISEDSLKSYYRPLLGDFNKTHAYALMVVDGESGKVTTELLAGQEDTPAADTEALIASGSREQVTSLLDESERMQNTLEEIQLTAKIIIENKKAELEKRLDQMGEFLSKMNKKVENLVKIITVLNLYTGKNVDIQQVTDGESADPGEPLSLRQRILYMDEELCAELDHEADHNDIPTFIESLRDPAFLSVIAPEPRCVVAVKPKHREMGYRSGNPYYDAARDTWNRHTYLVFRNGEKVFVLDSEDLELWDYAFPHSDFEEKFQQRMADPGQSFKDSLQKEHESERYRTTKYMVFLQGIVDSSDILGPFKTAPNIMKHQGIELVRDDENLIGTGRKPWREFRDEKNKLIRRGTRILYDGGGILRDGPHKWNSGGDFPKYYAYEASMPSTPMSGIYHADSYERVVRYDHGKPVTEVADYLVFRYLPGDTIWKRSYYGYDEADRKNKVAWKYSKSHVLNYDAVTVDELQGYLSDRTLREDFRDMMPLLKKTLLEKRREERDEADFKALLASEAKKSTGKDCPAEVIDEAVAWWKQKVIFTRPLSSDDAKAFRMIMGHIKNKR